jgi:hypothetical protein
MSELVQGSMRHVHCVSVLTQLHHMCCRRWSGCVSRPFGVWVCWGWSRNECRSCIGSTWLELLGWRVLRVLAVCTRLTVAEAVPCVTAAIGRVQSSTAQLARSGELQRCCLSWGVVCRVGWPRMVSACTIACHIASRLLCAVCASIRRLQLL